MTRIKRLPKSFEDVAMIEYTDEGERLRDEAIARVNIPSFSNAVCDCIRESLPPGLLFTTDDVWDLLDQAHIEIPKEKRAMGAAMVRARCLGLCAETPNFVPTRRKSSHKSPQRVWRRT